jgi:hypothetical protein
MSLRRSIPVTGSTLPILLPDPSVNYTQIPHLVIANVILDRIPCFLYHDVIPNNHPARFLLQRLIHPESPSPPLRPQRIWHHILSSLGSCSLLPRVTCSSVIFPPSSWITTAVLDLISARLSGTVPSSIPSLPFLWTTTVANTTPMQTLHLFCMIQLVHSRVLNELFGVELIRTVNFTEGFHGLHDCCTLVSEPLLSINVPCLCQSSIFASPAGQSFRYL